MEIVVPLIAFIKSSATEVTGVIAILVLLFTMVLKLHQTDLTTTTSIGKLQQDNLVVLMAQNKQLFDEINMLRMKMGDTYVVMEDMRNQINELEDLVRQYKRKCDTCPGPGGPPLL